MADHTFELRVRPTEGGMKLELYQLPPQGTHVDSKAKLVSYVNEEELSLLQAAVAKALKHNKYAFSDLKRTRKVPFKLIEEDGIRLDLVFRAVKGIVKRSRIEEIMQGITSMGREEAYYWHAKTSSGMDAADRRGIRALRTLLAEE